MFQRPSISAGVYSRFLLATYLVRACGRHEDVCLGYYTQDTAVAVVLLQLLPAAYTSANYGETGFANHPGKCVFSKNG